MLSASVPRGSRDFEILAIFRTSDVVCCICTLALTSSKGRSAGVWCLKTFG